MEGQLLVYLQILYSILGGDSQDGRKSLDAIQHAVYALSQVTSSSLHHSQQGKYHSHFPR